MQREAREIADRAVSRKYHYSALLGRPTLSRLEKLRARWGATQEAIVRLLGEGEASEPLRGPRFDTEIEAALGTMTLCWAESSRSLQGICRARGIPYLHVLQPTLHDEGSKPLTPAEIESGRAKQAFVEGVRRGYPMLRRAGAELRAAGVNFVDCSLIFQDVETGLYFDACHFRKTGITMLAERIAEGLLAVLPPA